MSTLSSLPALAVKTPLERQREVMSLADLAQTGQLRQQQIKGAQMDNQMRSQAMQEEDVIRQTMKQTGGSIGDALPALRGKISPDSWMKLQQADNQIQQQLSQRKTHELDLELKKSQAARNILRYGLTVPDERYQAEWPRIAGEVRRIKPELQLSQPLSKQQLEQLHDALGTEEQYLKKEAEKRAERQLTETERHNRATEQSKEESPAAADARYRFVLQKRQLNQPISGDDLAFAAAYEKQKTLVPQFNINNRPDPSGVYVATTDAQGNITNFYNNRNPRDIIPVGKDGMRKSGLPSEERKELAGFDVLTGQLDDLRKAVIQKPDSVGPVAGTLGNLQAVTIGGNTDEASIYQTIKDINNQIVYLRSGKQINEQEFKRLKAAMPHEKLPYDTFMVRLDNITKTLSELQQRRKSPTGRPQGGSQGGSGKTINYKIVNGQLVPE